MLGYQDVDDFHRMDRKEGKFSSKHLQLSIVFGANLSAEEESHERSCRDRFLVREVKW